MEKFPAHTSRHEGESTSELPEKARFELRQALVEVLVNDLAMKEKDGLDKKRGRAKNG